MKTKTVKIQNRHSSGKDEPKLRKAPLLFASCNLIVSLNRLITESGSSKFLAESFVKWSLIIQNSVTYDTKIILFTYESITICYLLKNGF